jgi:Tol biopolymer transport system component
VRYALVLAVAALALGVSTSGSSAPGPVHWIAFHADPRSSGDLFLDSPDGRQRRRLTRFFGQIPTAAWSPDGSRLALLARPRGVVDVYVIDVDGRNLRQLTRNEGDHFGDVAWSPDGQSLAFTCCGEEDEAIFTMHPDGSGRIRIADDSGQPAWSPDGTRIAFTSFRDGNPEVYVANADGSDPRRLTSKRAADTDPTWSPDGRRIAFTSARTGREQVFVMDADGANQRRLVVDRWSDQRPAWSRDGGRLVFTSFRNRDPNLLGIGNAEVVVVRADGTGARNLTHSPAWEGEPAWSPEGKRIAFATRRDFGPRGIFRVGVMTAAGTGVKLLPIVPGEGNAGGKANACCPAWQP